MIYIGWWRLGRYLKSGFGQLRCNCNGKSMWNSCTLCTGRAQKPALNMSFLWGWWRKGQFCESEKSPWFPDPALKPGLAWCSDCRGGTRTRQPRQEYRELQKYNPNSKNTRLQKRNIIRLHCQSNDFEDFDGDFKNLFVLLRELLWSFLWSDPVEECLDHLLRLRMTMMTTVIKIRKVEMVGSTSVKFTLICNRDDFDRVVILMMILGLTAAIRNLLRSFQQRLNQFDNEEAADIGYTLVPSKEMFWWYFGSQFIIV